MKLRMLANHLEQVIDRNLLALRESRHQGIPLHHPLRLRQNIRQRIPLAHTIYGGTKKLMSLIQKKPAGTQRVVLIDFPSPELKSVGFVTRTFRDASGREFAAVYVPTTPNPTGGYLEIVPLERLVVTDWTVDQAMAFILSAGAAAPDDLPFEIERRVASP